ncbi:MAG TPA: site-2 protease family protein [Thermoanaerobaculia bacterium]|jgi:Zn-dependent protease
MFGPRIHLFRLFGFPIRLDLSWFLVAVLVAWSLAAGYFPQTYPDLGKPVYWTMGIVGSLGLFVSVVLHELAHALVARRFGLEIKGITLFIFGGVAEMADEPPSPRAEFMVAIAGPLASLGIALGCLGLNQLGQEGAWPLAVEAVIGYLGLVNALLVAFNIVPAFPLDGGRVLRSILWHWKDNLRWATRVTSAIGSAFGVGLIVLGVVAFIRGAYVSGMWWFLIGLFLRNAAQMSYQQLLVRRVLEGELVSRFMVRDPVTVPRAISVRELVEDYVYQHHFKMFPVVDGERLLGCVTTRRIKELPREEWESQSVGAIAEPCRDENTVGPGDDALAALAKMSGRQLSRLMVVEGERLVGVLALKDMLQFLSLKVELEGSA